LKLTRGVGAKGRGLGGDPRASDRLRVLIVEDNVFYAEALRCLLEREGYIVVGVTDHAATSFDLARSERPDLALVDLHLCDGCSGPELGRCLASEGVCVLFLTSAPALAPTDERGLFGVLLKPCGDARLLRAVAEARERISRG
jgi:two-component system, response regulator PdtaR